jgi:hypothetical protein
VTTVNAVLGRAEDEVAGQPRTGSAGSLDSDTEKDPPRLESFLMGPHIRIVTRCLSAWPISGLASKTLPSAGTIKAFWNE